MNNRRKAIRVDFVKFAQLSTRDGAIVRDCQVRDLSSRGAKLVVTDHADLPDDVLLHLPLDGVTWPCRIMRRRGSEIGVHFYLIGIAGDAEWQTAGGDYKVSFAA